LVRAWDEEQARKALASHAHHHPAHAPNQRRD
jgi:hypothetical protein